MRTPISLARRNWRPNDWRNPRSSAFHVVILAVVCALASPVVAQKNSGQDAKLAKDAMLAKFVPEDVGLFIEIHGLADRLRRFWRNPQFARISEFPPWQKWNKNQGKALSRIGRQVAQHLGVEVSDVWDKVLGGELAVAVWPAEKKERKKSPAVLLIRASDGETLRKVAAGFRAQTRSKDHVEWSLSSHAAGTYHVGVRRDKPNFYLAVLDTTGIFSESQRHFLQVLDLYGRNLDRRSGSSNLAELDEYKTAKKSHLASTTVSVYLNPRPWEILMLADIETARNAKQRADKQAVFETWQAIQSVSVSLRIEPQLAVQAVVKYRPESLPKLVSEVLSCFSGTSGFLDRVGDDCLLAAAGRVDVERLVQLVLRHRPAAPRLNNDVAVIARVLRMLGPEFGAFIQDDESGKDVASQLQWAIAVAIRPNLSGDESSKVKAAVNSAQPMLLQIARTISLLGGEGFELIEIGVRLSGDKSWRRAMQTISIVDDQIWASSSLEAVREVDSTRADSTRADSLADSPVLKQHLSPLVANPTHAVFVNLAGWRRFLNRNRKAIIRVTAKDRGVSSKVTQRGFDQLLSLLKLTDTLAVAVKLDGDRIALSLSLSVEGRP